MNTITIEVHKNGTVVKKGEKAEGVICLDAYETIKQVLIELYGNNNEAVIALETIVKKLKSDGGTAPTVLQ